MRDFLTDGKTLWSVITAVLAIGIAYGTLHTQIEMIRSDLHAEKQEIKASRTTMTETTRAMGEMLARIDERTRRIEMQINNTTQR